MYSATRYLQTKYTEVEQIVYLTYSKLLLICGVSQAKELGVVMRIHQFYW